MYSVHAEFPYTDDEGFDSLFLGLTKDMPIKELMDYLRSQAQEFNLIASEYYGTDIPEAGEYTFKVSKAKSFRELQYVHVEWTCEELEMHVFYENLAKKPSKLFNKINNCLKN